MSTASENLITWGDCDSAGIIYFPKYFYFMDVAFQTLLRNAGLTHHTIHEQFGARLPVVEAGAKFIAPVTFDERLVVEAQIVHWGSTSFRVSYQGSRDGTAVFEGSEARVWAMIDSDGKVKAVPIPPQFKAALSALHGTGK